MKYYIICGERSGDLHASNLVKHIKEKDQNAVFRFVGGDHLSSVLGIESQFMHYDEVSFMLITQVIANLGKINNRLKLTIKDILDFRPDALILVDFSGFNMRVASKIKSSGIAIHYYISPKIWAWNQKRVFKIKKLVDHMYVIIPFEKDFYQSFDYEVDYVGNPILDSIAAFVPDAHFRLKNKLDERPIVAVLPGSRRQEVSGTLKTILDFSKQHGDFQFVIAGVPNLPQSFYEPCLNLGLKVVFGQTYDLLHHAHAGVVTSGTATLETALFSVPQVVVYETNLLTYVLAKSVLKIKHISLVNLIADKPIVKELIYKDFTVENLNTEFLKIVSVEDRERVLNDYASLKKIIGEPGASERCAQLIVERSISRN